MAKRTRDRLSDLTVRKAKEPGWYGDGGGLYLRVYPDGAKRWVFVFRWAGKRTEMSFGPLADLGLADARDERDAARRLVKAGKSPIVERRAEKAREAAKASSGTFASWAREIAPAVAPRATKAHEAWLRMMTEWVGPMKSKAVYEITTEDVLAALKPYWKSRPETGRRMRMRIEKVLDAAKAKGLIASPWENPARLKGHLEHLLEERTAAVKHHTAMPYADVPGFMQSLTARETIAAYALRFTILTAARTGEVIFAKWSEIDGEVWVCPAERMKMKREHRVPLTPAALAVLEKVKPLGGRSGDWIFPSRQRKGRPLSTAAMDRVLDDMGLAGRATVHGFRAAFRDWAGDKTDFPREVIEAALAHLVGDETERAYRRGDALEKRLLLMKAWARYCTTPPASLRLVS